MATSPTSSMSSDSDISLRAQDDPNPGHFSPRFNQHYADSDLILRTSDNILFRVHKARLAGSDVFRDMFEIGSQELEENAEIPAITLTEDAQTLENVLPFFYGEYPDVDSLPFDQVLGAFQTAIKYSMSLVEHIYTTRLRYITSSLNNPDRNTEKFHAQADDAQWHDWRPSFHVVEAMYYTRQARSRCTSSTAYH